MSTNPQYSTSHPNRSKNLPPDLRVAVIGLIGSLLLSTVATMALFFVSPSSAQAASYHEHLPLLNCSSSVPCRGQVQWPNAIWGAQSEFQTVNLVGVVGAGVQNRLLLEDVTHGCFNSSDSWFSAGYSTHNVPWYFWEVCAPGGVVQTHYLYQVPANNFGVYFNYRMYRYDSGTYKVDFSGDDGTWYWTGTYDQNPNNPIMANQIVLGEKAFALSDHSDTAFYRHNQWEDNVNGGWHWQNSNGTIINNNPPSFGWNQRPSDYPNTGGLGNTCWC